MQINKDKYNVESQKKSGRVANGLTFLEQLNELASEDCSALNVPFFYRVNEVDKRVEFAKGTCNMWSCDTCGARNAKRWIARIIDGCNRLDAKSWYFATITAHRKWRGSNRSLVNIRKNWNQLRMRMMRLTNELGEAFYYARVWEAHKDGSFHMHLITNAPVSTRWLKDNSAQCGLGYQAKFDEVVNAGQVAGYVSKYMLKAMPYATWYPKGARRIEVSRNWVSWHEPGGSEWYFLKSFEEAKFKADIYKRNDWKVFDKILKHEEKRRKQNEDVQGNS
jgi:hypothetical protein